MIDLSVAKPKFFRRKAKFLSEESKKKVFLDSWVKFRRLEVREKVRNVFVTSLRLSDHKVLHDIASVLIKFFRFRSDDLLAFFYGVPSPPKINFAKQHSTLSYNFQLHFSTTNCNEYNIQRHLITFIFNV